jgi:hypothetical protein
MLSLSKHAQRLSQSAKKGTVPFLFYSDVTLNFAISPAGAMLRPWIKGERRWLF